MCGAEDNFLWMNRFNYPITVLYFQWQVYWRNGRPEVKEGAKMSSSCLQAMRSARDRHEQNVELVRRGAALLACTVRAVGRGEELLMWYGDGLAREVGVPILNPCHIRGMSKNYF